MKKHLIAAAVAGAFAVPAMAQVTIYGIVDQGYLNEKLKVSEGNDSGTVKRAGLNSVVAGSRLGFRGEEDLGGGLKAGFTLEYAIAPDENNGVGTGASPNRQSFVSLGGAFGEVRFGRQLTLHHVNQGAGDLLGNLNALSGYIGSQDSAVRTNNAITFTSPSLSGFTIAAQKGFHETAEVSGVDSDKTNDQSAFRLNYSAGPLGVGVATETIKDVSISLANFIGQGAEINLGTVDKKRANNLYVTYDLGVARLGLVSNNTKFSDEGGSVKWTANTLTAAVPLGAITVHASFGTGKFKGDGETLAKPTGYQLGAQYAISKRTSAYAYAGQTNLKPTEASLKYQTYALGVRHNF